MLEPIEYKVTIGLELVSGDTYNFQFFTNSTPNGSIAFRQTIDLNRDDRAFSSPELKILQSVSIFWKTDRCEVLNPLSARERHRRFCLSAVPNDRHQHCNVRDQPRSELGDLFAAPPYPIPRPLRL